LAFWVYVLQCADRKYYIGHSDDLERRIAQHQTGGFCDFTSRRRPVRLMWSECFPTRIEALEAERRIKPWSRAKKEALFVGDWASISYFTKPPSERPSTSLGTKGDGATHSEKAAGTKNPFVSSEVETRLPLGTGE
jgi:putative endonuclease